MLEWEFDAYCDASDAIDIRSAWYTTCTHDSLHEVFLKKIGIENKSNNEHDRIESKNRIKAEALALIKKQEDTNATGS